MGDQLDLFGYPPMPAKLSGHPLYGVWANMKRRCHNPRHHSFHNYGQRGIAVCDEWRSSRAFIAWALSNGWQLGLEIDRINTCGPYSPLNCRFVTRRENSLNRRDTARLSDGRPAWPVAQAAGILRGTFTMRLYYGWSPDAAAGLVPRQPKPRK